MHMLSGNVSDKTLQQQVNQKLSRTGTGGQSRVTSSVVKGTVTLAGTLQYEAQRRPIVKAVSTVGGVRRVVDQMKFEPRKRQ
jgi:osmotically-inducible protein OsmY